MTEPDDRTLRLLFSLMGLVSAAMIAAVIYTKVLREDASDPTLGEMRSVDRLCDVRCGNRAKEIASASSDDEDLMRRARACLAECRAELGEALKRR